MRRVFFLLLFVAFISLASGQEQRIEPKLVGGGVFSLQLNWTVDFGGQNPQSASFTSFAFFNNGRQQVSFTTPTPYTSSVDSFGNNLLTFTLVPSQQRQIVTMNALISSRSAGEFEQVTGDLSAFTQPSEYVVITPQIAAKAAELVGSEINPLKKATILTSWVHNNVAYDLSYKDRILDSQKVFEGRRGVCNEFSHLLIAMLRSQGVSARFAAGFVYSGEIWAPHAWIEVSSNGKWYSFDPTYNEGMLLDATHIKFANGVDQSDVTEQFSAVGNVDLSQVSLTRSHEVVINSYSTISTAPVLEMFITNETVGSNSIQNVTVSIQSQYNELVAYPISLDAPSEVNIVSQRTTLLMFLPGEKKFFSWQVLIPSDLREGFIYTYPLVARSLGAKIEGVLQAQKNGVQTEQLSLLQVSEVRLNGASLVVSIHNAGNILFQNATLDIQLALANLSQNFSVAPGENAEIIFPVLNFNVSREITGVILLTAENYSSSQNFVIRPATTAEPARPAFNIQAGKSLIQENILNKYEGYLPYGLAAIVLIFFISIILIKVRS